MATANVMMKQQDLYVSATILDGVYYTGNNDVLQFATSSNTTNNGISYVKDVTGFWSISGYAVNESKHSLLQSYNCIPSYIKRGAEYRIQLDPKSTGDIIPIRITFYFNDSTTQVIEYPVEIDYEDQDSKSLKPRIIEIPNDAKGISVQHVIRANTSVFSYIAYRLVALKDSRITSVTYGTTYKLYISGGSGNGTYVYNCLPVTGKSSITASGVLSFESPGSVQVHIIKKGSIVNEIDPTTHSTVVHEYAQSKTLVLEVTWKSRQVVVKVIPESVDRDIGEFKPSSPTYPFPQGSLFGTEVEGLDPLDALENNPVLYFVNESESFYKFDVLSKAYSENSYNNGIQYIKNPDGSWTVKGTATAESVCFLINSPEYLPNYIIPGREYQLRLNEGTVPLYICWYLEDREPDSSTYSSPEYDTEPVVVPESTVGVVIKFLIPQGTTLDTTINYNLLDVTERKIDIYHEGSYPVAASGAKLPESNKYISKIKYRSAKLNYINTKPYRIYTDVSGEGVLECKFLRQLPYETVEFSVTTNTGSYYQDGFPDTYVDGSESTGIGLANSFYVWDSTNQNYINFRRISHRDKSYRSGDSNVSWLSSGTYSFKMPVGEVSIYCKFSSLMVNSSLIEFLPLNYEDVSPLPDDYLSALRFCAYARIVFFNELPDNNYPAILQGETTSQFYEHGQDAEHNAFIVRQLRRKYLVRAIRRISHFKEDDSLSSETDTAYNPDNAYQNQSIHENAPVARFYTYAGFPPEPLSNFIGGSDKVKYTNTGTTFSPSIIHNYNQLSPTPALRLNHANDDYLENFTHFPSIAWGTVTGVVQGYNAYEYAPNTFALFREVVTALWRYARFKQLPVAVTGSHAYQSTSDDSSWYHNAMYWAIDNNIIPNVHINWLWNSQYETWNIISNQWKSDGTDLIDKAEFAYMLWKFCTLYAW